MTPYERENARKRFQKFHDLSPEEKQALRDKWAEYQNFLKKSVRTYAKIW